LKKTVDLYRAASAPAVPEPTHDRLLELINREWSRPHGTQERSRK
jgi:hypothetical protein